ncbi:MAG: CDP-diacylglycerol--serine O-phosphatidyltransferase [Myxococcales bacterium]|nr:CDP-diacylglycerol--serine O-phosphatidyltransferase [Myxococcota bacterium]MDW8280468.1 CDP-diacylglycerol--serine O-phosphatidyltransferase [Myxococcales bacterium]
MHPRKTFFILPNLFTLGGIFCGLFSLALTMGEPTPTQLYQAAMAVAYGLFFDLADGRVARLTRTQSALGLQLDSLADVITFGVAPAMLMYKWGLSRLVSIVPHIGLIVAFLYVAAAALRLARFNVLSLESTVAKKDPGAFILGMPVPVAAAILVVLVAVNHQLAERGSQVASISDGTLAVVVVVLSCLMVSKIRFRSFKNVKMRSRRFIMAAGTILSLLGLVIVLRQPYFLVFAGLLAAYVALGLFEEIVFLRRRRAEARDARAEEINEGRAESDEDVLHELGAFEDQDTAHKPAV